MNNKRIAVYLLVISVIIVLIRYVNNLNTNKDLFSKQVKVSLRAVGSQLLLTNNDSVSEVLPIVEFEKLKYRISFQNKLSIKPDDLVTFIKNFEDRLLLSHYLVEVIQCSDKEVSYSYEFNNNEKNLIVPCLRRSLDSNCYTIEVEIIEKIKETLKFFYTLSFLVLILIIYIYSRSKQVIINKTDDSNYKSFGGFKFYEDQNRLIHRELEISLSRKECELLIIFVENLNKTVKRDELMKRVWEDNGVFVGRSLDTYISKLRKILKIDSSIKLVNIHGVGYKLEIVKK